MSSSYEKWDGITRYPRSHTYVAPQNELETMRTPDERYLEEQRLLMFMEQKLPWVEGGKPIDPNSEWDGVHRTPMSRGVVYSTSNPEPNKTPEDIFIEDQELLMELNQELPWNSDKADSQVE